MTDPKHISEILMETKIYQEWKSRVDVKMTAYTYPGLPFLCDKLTDEFIVEQINKAFDLDNDAWIKSKCRQMVYRVPRQVLMSCLIELMDWSDRTAGAYCNKDHATANHSKQIVTKTLMNDHEYGERVRMVYNACKSVKK